MSYVGYRLYTHYFHPETEVAGASVCRCHLGLALPKLLNLGLWWGQGTTGRSAVLDLYTYPILIEWFFLWNLTLQKALFEGVRDLVLVVSKSRCGLDKMAGCSAGRLHIRAIGPNEFGQNKYVAATRDRKNCQDAGCGVCAWL